MSYTYQYPRPAVTADIIIFSDEGSSVLLIRRGNDPYKGCWAFPGGFFDMKDADIEHTAMRELQEETSLTDIPLQLVCLASKEGRDPRGRTVTAVFMGDVEREKVHPQGGDDAREAHWFSLKELPTLAFDHAEILQKALALRKK
jgi:8-oxo-dGTP diphosphatase